MSDSYDPTLPVKCEVQTWHTRIIEKGETKRSIIHEGEDEEQDDSYALTVERYFDKKNKLEYSTLTIRSQHILQAFHEVVANHPTLPTDFTKEVELKSPFQVLIHHWEDLHRHTDTLEHDEARMHMKLLLRWMKNELGKTKTSLDLQHESGHVQYDTLWTIFRPNDFAIHYKKSHVWLLRIEKAIYEENHTEGKYVDVHCTFTDHNELFAGRATEIFRILQKRSFGQDDPAKITSLDVYPLRFAKVDKTELQDMLYERGKQYLAIAKSVQVVGYDGYAQYALVPPSSWWHPNMDEDPLVWTAFTESGRVVLDRKTYSEEHIAPTVSRKNNLTKDDIILCPPFAYGYSNSLKEWCRFFLGNTRDPDWRPAPFVDLVMDAEKKLLVQALVSAHSYPDNARDQPLQKGKGLVCLLHGTPGSGKTLTAECAAELTKKALFTCSMSELNKYDNPWLFERNLKSILRFATTWKAVVLLDEADVFLEARLDGVSANAERNALVAIFLRHLEYFSGIIFLTTNRISVFDAAMKSRIHLALEFSPPSLTARRLLWQNQITKLHDHPTGSELDELLDSLQLEPLNGREIANSVLTAATLARYSNEKFEAKHLDSILKVQSDFSHALRRKRNSMAMQEQGLKHTGSWLSRKGTIVEEPEDMS